MGVTKSLYIIKFKKRKDNCVRSKKKDLVIERKERKAFQNWELTDRVQETVYS